MSSKSLDDSGYIIIINNIILQAYLFSSYGLVPALHGPHVHQLLFIRSPFLREFTVPVIMESLLVCTAFKFSCCVGFMYNDIPC